MSRSFVRPLIEAEPMSSLPTSRDVLEALVAAGAIMAHADGEMAGAERRKIMSLVRRHPLLSAFPHDDVVAEIGMHEANYGLDPEVALLLAREKLVKVSGDRRFSQVIVDAARAIVPVDGVAHPSEFRALAEIREALALEPHAHGPAAAPEGPRALLAR